MCSVLQGLRWTVIVCKQYRRLLKSWLASKYMSKIESTPMTTNQKAAQRRRFAGCVQQTIRLTLGKLGLCDEDTLVMGFGCFSLLDHSRSWALLLFNTSSTYCLHWPPKTNMLPWSQSPANSIHYLLMTGEYGAEAGKRRTGQGLGVLFSEFSSPYQSTSSMPFVKGHLHLSQCSIWLQTELLKFSSKVCFAPFSLWRTDLPPPVTPIHLHPHIYMPGSTLRSALIYAQPSSHSSSYLSIRLIMMR